MFKKIVLSCAAIGMLLAHNPVLGKIPPLGHSFIDQNNPSKVSSRTPVSDEDFKSKNKAKKIFGAIWKPFSKTGTYIREWSDKHPIASKLLIFIGSTIVSLAAFVIYDQTVNAHHLHALHEEHDLLRNLATSTNDQVRGVNNDLVTHIVESFNSNSEARLDLNTITEQLKQILENQARAQGSYETEPTVVLVR